MFLSSVSLTNFKSHSDFKTHFSSQLVCITGPNGVGKTNILDAIYFLSLTRSFQQSHDQLLIRKGQPYLLIDASFLESNSDIGESTLIKAYLESGKRKEFRVNNQPYTKISDHIGKIPVVLADPDSIRLINGGSEERRRYLDETLCQLDHSYLGALSTYMKTLLQRNAYLKQLFERRQFTPDREMMDTYNTILVETGTYIHEKRKNYLDRFNDYFQTFYEYISGGNEQLQVVYDSQLNTDHYSLLLSHNERDDLYSGRTGVGIHKDELQLLLDEQPVRKFGSQGQKKSVLLSLKISLGQIFADFTGRKPILLLDDLFDKLDEKRSGALLEKVTDNAFSQVFVTDTSMVRLERLLSSESKVQKIVLS